VGTFVFLAEAQNVVSPIKGDTFSIAENVHFPSRNTWGRRPISGKWAPPHYFNVPLDTKSDEAVSPFLTDAAECVATGDFEKGIKGSKIQGKVGIRVAGLGGQNEHQFEPGGHEICM
jgi:hypothetical protein